MPLCTHLALASAPEILLMWLEKTFHSREPQISSPTYPRRPPILNTYLSSTPQHLPILNTYLSSTPTYPQHLPILNTYLSSTPTYPQHLPILATYRTVQNPEGPRVRKVSAMRHLVLLDIADISLWTESSKHKAAGYTR